MLGEAEAKRVYNNIMEGKDDGPYQDGRKKK
jgi:hypothetical protein